MSTHDGLVVCGLHAGYPGVPVLHGVDLDVRPGEVTALVGANGAGKSTLLGAVLGTVSRTAGTVAFGGSPLVGGPRAAARRGVAVVPEGRRVFARRTVTDNLLLGAWVRRRDRGGVRADREAVYERFPVLARRRSQPAGALSGGEAQMLAIGMALMARPQLLLLDEPSLGLAPLVVDEVLREVRALASDGMAVLLVEQVVSKALRAADSGYVLRRGEVVLHGPAASLAGADVAATYLGHY